LTRAAGYREVRVSNVRRFAAGMWLLSGVLSAIGLAACRQAPKSLPPEHVLVTRPVGSWSGRGNSTIGVVSDSGKFHLDWEAKNERPKGSGTFRLAVHSAVSGRPIQLITESRGETTGSADFQDDPRIYNLMIESANVDWTVSVQEVVVTTRPAPPRE
jgi:hypothetical protein